MVNIKIDDKDYEVEEGLAIIQACEIAGVKVPRFCYHEKLSVASNYILGLSLFFNHFYIF